MNTKLSTKIINFLEQLVSVESVKGNYNELNRALDVCTRYLNGYTIERFESNKIPSILIYKGSRRPKKFKIILNAHLDVVPAKKELFKLKQKGNKLYGRGVYDMKGGAVCEILSFLEVSGKVNYPLALQLVTDEEIGGFDGTLHQLKKGVRCEFVLAGEPTDLNIGNQAKGIIWVKVNVEGKEGHSAYLWEGDNAVKKGSEFINELVKRYPIPRKEVWRTTANISYFITDNNSFNKVPGQSEIAVDIRYLPGKRKEVLYFLKKISKKYKVNFEIVFEGKSYYTAVNNVYLHKLNKILKYYHKQSKYNKIHGSSDIRHYTEYGIPGVVFGPIGCDIHSDNEWVSIDSLEKYYNILTSFLLTL